MKIQRFMTWPLAVTLAGVAGLIVVTLAPQTAEAIRVRRTVDMECVDKTVSPGLVFENTNTNLTYVVTVRNNGNRTANDVDVTDTLPPEIPATATFVSATPSQGTCDPPNGTLTCNLGSMAAGTQATVTIVVNVTAVLTDTFRNFASVSTSSTETNTGNNGGEASDCDVEVIVVGVEEPNLACRNKTADPTTLTEGISANVLYTVTIDNNGFATATGVSVKDTLTVSKDVTFVSSNIGDNCGLTPGSTILMSGDMFTCNLGDIDAGDTATLEITVNVPTPGAADIFANSAVASATNADDSNICEVMVTVVGGGEGCTPGGWRNHEEAWPEPFDPVDLFNDAVGGGFMNTVDDLLVQGQSAAGEHDGAIWLNGGGNRKRYRHGMACLLNAASPLVSYDLTVEQCKDIIRTGSSNGLDINDVADFNEQGCNAF